MAVTLAQVLELTDRVQAAIDAGDWVTAQDLETQRRGVIEQLVADQDDERGGIAAALAQLYERNLRMIGEVQHHQRRVLRDASLVKTGHLAVAAYGAAHAKVG